MTVERIANTDFQSLQDLKRLAGEDSKKALPQVAKQFEGIFLQTLLKTMRMGSHFVEENSPFRGRNAETFQDMLDGQYVGKMTSSSSGIGIAEMLTKQLGGTVDSTNKTTKIGQIAHKYTIPNRDALKMDHVKATDKEQATNSGKQMIDGFINSIWDKARQAATAMGLDPKVLIAQAALETGWGQSIAKDTNGASSNNLFNIKSGTNSDNAVQVKTTEYIAGTPIKMSASFRKYTSIEDSFNDYVSLIKTNDRYQNALANTGDPDRYVMELGKAGYATDPQYGKKILSIYHSNELNEAIKRCGLSGQI